MIVYKIRIADGRFSRGGAYVSFNKIGKIWKRKSDLTSHLSQLAQHSRKTYEDLGAEVVEYELSEREVVSMSVQEYLYQRDELKRMREEERQQWLREYEKQMRKKAWEELNKEFGNK